MEQTPERKSQRCFFGRKPCPPELVPENLGVPHPSGELLQGKGSSGINNDLNSKPKGFKGEQAARVHRGRRLSKRSTGFLLARFHPRATGARASTGTAKVTTDTHLFRAIGATARSRQAKLDVDIINIKHHAQGKINLNYRQAATGAGPPLPGPSGAWRWSCRERL